ncbi:MAG: hypothetical protein HQ523_16675 [Lentisphaerae bacterium]|nr:hypothetical protein [Lentisphaerota bacterium]
MMAQWIREAGFVVQHLIGTIGSQTEYRVLVAIVAIAFLLGLFNIAAAMGATMATPMRVVLVSAIGTLIVLAAVVAVRLYLLPKLHTNAMTPWLPLVVSGMVLLIIVAPLTHRLVSMGYFEAVMALVLSVAATALILAISHAGFNAFRDGDKGFNKTHHRRDDLNRIIDDV